LKYKDKLVSPNGECELLMQDDGNLVLAQGSNPYWATNTEWLPASQRPTHVVMEEDAQLEMFDDTQVLRWASGTWGDFSDPYVILQDDGNLVITDKAGQLVWASGDADGRGAIAARGEVSDPSGVNSAVDACGRMPTVVSGSTNLSTPSQRSVDVNGVAYIITEQRRRLVNDVIEQSFLQAISQMGAWPGQVIQGKALLTGDVAPIGPLARQPGTVEVVTDIVTNNPHEQSAIVDHPDAASVDQTRRDILLALKPVDSPGLLKMDIEKADTLREVGVKIGVSVQGSAFGVDANATLDETHRQSTVVASIRQIFYDVTFTPQGSQATGIWLDSVSVGDLQHYMGAGNPPLYIDSVQYGRFICVTAQAGYSSSEITAALKAHWTATVSGQGSIDVHYKEILENSTVKVYTLGVPGHGQFQDLADPIAELGKVYTSGLSLTSTNPGVPISFTCRHIADGTLAHVGLAAEYIAPLSAVGPDVVDAPFEVYDGPGGGLVDTHIVVNPGDTLTLNAEGMIWTGNFGWGDTGPEGWQGHQSTTGSPMKGQGAAYCLVARLGNNDWFEADRFWEGEIQAGQGGTLALAPNDDNPYNGDPSKRWLVRVNVKRANAAAVGIFV
jgi:hypothetical protein